MMAQYMLILRESKIDFADISAEEIEKVIGDYMAWSNKLGEEGKLVGGEKLKDDGGKHLSINNGSLRVTDGPFTEAKEIIGGYFTINAANYEEAVKIAETCPHLKYGGRIELREVESM